MPGAIRGQLAVASGSAGVTELAFTGPGMTATLAFVGGAMALSGAALSQFARRRLEQ